jgi:ABC-type phosphate/phosphonate transport system permease subunit
LKKTTSLPFVALILFLLSASVAFSEVPIRIRIIQASNVRSGADPSFVDRALKDIYRELGTLLALIILALGLN